MIKLDAMQLMIRSLSPLSKKGVDLFQSKSYSQAEVSLNLKINEKGFRQPLGRITGDLG